MLIVPSKQLLLITAQQSKEIFLFDPKTTSVLTKYHTQPTLSKALAYYPYSNQFLTTYTNKTFINIYSTDNQEVINKVSTIDVITYMEVSIQKNVLFAGSQNGNLYVWELPTGILIRKATVHSNEVKKIIQYKDGYLLTCGKNQIKFWNLASFYIETERSTPIKIINFVLDIVDVSYARNIFYAFTSKAVTSYIGGNEYNNTFPQLNKEDISFPTKACTSLSHLYIGDFQGSIHISQIPSQQSSSYELDFHFNQLTQELQIGRLGKKTVIKGQNKYPITCLTHLNTLPYLISGNSDGEIFIYQNHTLKKSLKLFKTSIKFIYSIPKPIEEKISQSIKLRPLAKYQNNKQTEPLEVDIERMLREKSFDVQNSALKQEYSLERQVEGIQAQADGQILLWQMLQVLSRPQNVLRNKISQLQQQRQMLVQTNIHYSSILCKQLQEPDIVQKQLNYF